ncbi:recombinase family protein [Marimonas sp. MJW-29]|uniref:Recombinase family protein n=1 Tax=Sulfitobacter sediminis TaxID=3234186 RepID=A0ABV3RN32_9RHOB
MKTCFGYIRVSTQKQGEGVSLVAQKDAITAYADRQGLSVIKWFEEKQTAAKGGRPIFNQMLGQLRRGRAQGVIIHKIDRSARNLRDWAMFSELPDLGIDVYVATESLDFTSRGGRLTADIQAVIAADYIRNLREETIKGLNGRLKQGLYPFRAPIGYLDNGKGQPKTPDPEKAPYIRQMFELYATGQYSLRSLRAEMNRRGLRNLAGRPLSLCGVETILSNPFYTGLIVISRTGQSYDGIHEPIVPASLFQRVQDLKAGRCGKKVTRHNHLYSGLFRCGLCGAPMSPELQKGNVYYRCQTPPCETKTVREDRLEAKILSALARLQLTPKQADALKSAWAEDHCEQEQAARRETISLQLASEESRFQRLTDLLIDGAIDQETFQQKKQALALSIKSHRENLAALPDPRQIQQDRMDFLELMKNLTTLHICATPMEKREIVENAFSNRTVVRRNIELKPQHWLQPSDSTQPVLSGTPYRDTSRTQPGISRLIKLLTKT